MKSQYGTMKPIPKPKGGRKGGCKPKGGRK